MQSGNEAPIGQPRIKRPLFAKLPFGRVLLQSGRPRRPKRTNVGRAPRAGLFRQMDSAGKYLVEGRPQWQQDDRPAERRQADDANHR